MGSHYTLENDFGPVNERVISERLAVYPSKEEPNINENNLDNSIQPSGGRGRIFLEDAG